MGVDVASEDDVFPVGGHLHRKVGRLRTRQLEDRDELGRDLAAPLQAERLRGGCQSEPIDRRRQQDRPAPVVDRAAPAGLGRGQRRLGSGPFLQVAPSDDLPPGEPRPEAARHDDERDEEEHEAGAGIGPTQHRSFDGLASRQDQRLAEWPKAKVDRLLADRRRGPESIEIGQDLAATAVEILGTLR